jgi:CRISPR-associated exonuclease Cas4
MLGIDVPAACVFSHADRHRHLIQVSPALKSRVEELASALRTVLRTSQLPKVVYDRRCHRCSLHHDCLPKLASAVAAAPDPFTVPSAEDPDD